MSIDYKPCKLVAEIGAVHLGSLARAKELCLLAKNAGADYVKTQKRNPDESTPEHMKNKPHPVPAYAYGATYLEHRKKLELSIEQHAELQRYCREIGIVYSTSVWDITSAREVINLNPPFIKIPSACNNHQEMLGILLSDYKGSIHVSTGMTTEEEMVRLDGMIAKNPDRFVVYHCTSAYPCPFEKLYLKEIPKLIERFPCEIGFSNHGKGISADIAAYTLGATWVERHFTDDRGVAHTDAPSSLEFDGLRKLKRDLVAVHRAMAEKPAQMDELEAEQRKKLKFGS